MLNVAVVQLPAHDRETFQDAWPFIEAALRAALDEGAKLVVLPEGTLPAYVLGTTPFEPSEIARQIERCQELARAAQAVVVIGAARRTGTRVTNSAIVIDADGSIAGAADKHFLWHFDRQWFAPAEQIEPVRTQLGTIGALVCADGRIPLIARALVEKGAQILVMPTAWVTSGRDPHNFENVQADLLARVRARENGVPFAAANKCGVEQRCVLYCGKSQIIGADGAVAAIAAQDRAQILSARVALEAAHPKRALVGAAGSLDAPQQPQRIAVTARALQDGDARRLATLEAQRIVHPDEPDMLDDAFMADPGALAQLRLRGATLACWKSEMEPDWQVTLARARALELRMYVIVIDTARSRAFAIDPDGAVVCGTTGAYEIASFAFEPSRTKSTLVAPGTDVLEGLTRAARHAAL